MPNEEMSSEPSRSVERLNELFPHQPLSSEPPYDLLNSLTNALGDLDPVGPAYIRDDLLQRFEKEVLSGSGIKTFVGNRPLNWLTDFASLNQEILTRLSCGEFSASEALAHLRRFDKKEFTRLGTKTFGDKLSNDGLIREGLVKIKERLRFKGINGGSEFIYAVSGRDWAAFFVELSELEFRGQRLGLECLQAARVLAIKEASIGGHIVARTLSLDSAKEKSRIKKMIGEWLKTGALKKVPRAVGGGKTSPFIVVGEWATE